MSGFCARLLAYPLTGSAKQSGRNSEKVGVGKSRTVSLIAVAFGSHALISLSLNGVFRLPSRGLHRAIRDANAVRRTRTVTSISPNYAILHDLTVKTHRLTRPGMDNREACTVRSRR
jgi:hypothetical protein